MSEGDEAKGGVLTERDVWISANMYVKRYGEDAPVHAAMRADELLAEGDMEGCMAFRRILKAIDELLATAPPEGVKPN